MLEREAKNRDYYLFWTTYNKNSNNDKRRCIIELHHLLSFLKESQKERVGCMYRTFASVYYRG